LLIKSKTDIETVGIPRNKFNGDSAIFLINTGNPSKTEPLVNLFLRKCDQPDYLHMINNNYIPFNNHCINNLISGDLDDFFNNLPLLSSLQYNHFGEMIPPEFKHVWKEGLDSNDYLDYEQTFIGDPPSVYFLHEICDGYRRLEFSNSSISPKLILYSDGVVVNGNFIWTEGLSETIYQPFYRRILESDRTTQDSVQVFNVNASVSCYIMDQDQYDSYAQDPNTKPATFNVLEYEEDSFNISLDFETLADPDPTEDNDYHLLIWHEEFYGGVSGTIIYNYEYTRGFVETYWSLIFAVLLLIVLVLFFAFQKFTLPPIVWTLSKLKYYIISVPWREIKATYFDLAEELGNIWSKLRGVEELEIEAEKECSSYSRFLVLFQAIIGFVGLHRYMVGKIGTAVVFTFTLGFLGIGYLIDLIAVITGTFYDSEEKKVKNWF